MKGIGSRKEAESLERYNKEGEEKATVYGSARTCGLGLRSISRCRRQDLRLRQVSQVTDMEISQAEQRKLVVSPWHLYKCLGLFREHCVPRALASEEGRELQKVRFPGPGGLKPSDLRTVSRWHPGLRQWRRVTTQSYASEAQIYVYRFNAGNPGSILGSGRSPGEGSGNPLRFSCLENSMDREAW